jgi:hypothetical protein
MSLKTGRNSRVSVWVVDGPLSGETLDIPRRANRFPAVIDHNITVWYEIEWYDPQPMAFQVNIEIMC